LPRCRACGGLVRPGVVWFGEAIPAAALDRSFAAAEDCDVFLSVGTSSLVYPAAGLAERALDRGTVVVEVNPQPTELARHAAFALAAAAGAALPTLCQAIEARQGRRPAGGQTP
jgi:NAD-dependent deacetylase